MNVMVEKAIKAGIMDAAIHARLIQNLEGYAKVAGVPPTMVCTPLKEYCSESEVDYVRHLKRHVSNGVYGLVFTGPPTSPINTKMLAIAGACLRNFINARVMTVQTLLADLKDDSMDQPTVLLVPNFHVGKAQGGSIPDWQVSLLLGLLYTRQSLGRQTFLYVEDMDLLEKEYGAAFSHHLKTTFKIVPA